jgi:hypothetical protein
VVLISQEKVVNPEDEAVKNVWKVGKLLTIDKTWNLWKYPTW